MYATLGRESFHWFFLACQMFYSTLHYASANACSVITPREGVGLRQKVKKQVRWDVGAQRGGCRSFQLLACGLLHHERGVRGGGRWVRRPTEEVLISSGQKIGHMIKLWFQLQRCACRGGGRKKSRGQNDEAGHQCSHQWFQRSRVQHSSFSDCF